MYTLYVGIDISAQEAHIYWSQLASQASGQFVIAQSQNGYQRLEARLKRLCPDPSQTHLVMEATANY